VDDEGSNKEGEGGKAMATAIRMVGNKEGNCNGGKSNDNKGGGQKMATMEMAMATAMVTVTMWAMVTATRVAGNKKGNGKGSKGNGNGNEGGGGQKGQGQ
jgi:hypothetical protein